MILLIFLPQKTIIEIKINILIFLKDLLFRSLLNIKQKGKKIILPNITNPPYLSWGNLKNQTNDIIIIDKNMREYFLLYVLDLLNFFNDKYVKININIIPSNKSDILLKK